MHSLLRPILVFGLTFFLCPTLAGATGDRFITIASTTSTENSGLLDSLIPKFKRETGIDVRVIVVGTGQAIRIATNGDADLLFVHHRPSEEKFVADGFGVERFDVMYNDFVLVGPSTDPCAIRAGGSVSDALTSIARSCGVFASRGDDSGTHKKERALWEHAKIDPRTAAWYRETGSGMGATLNTASALDAYTLTDRATWLRFANKGSLELLVEEDPLLLNSYGITLVNPERHPHVKAADAQRFIDWIVSLAGQTAIGAYRIDGQQAFFPNASVRSEGLADDAR